MIFIATIIAAAIWVNWYVSTADQRRYRKLWIQIYMGQNPSATIAEARDAYSRHQDKVDAR